jgi:hypothetical protein
VNALAKRSKNADTVRDKVKEIIREVRDIVGFVLPKEEEAFAQDVGLLGMEEEGWVRYHS